ncbi:MAG: septum formation initiator family protein [Alistipes sp.]|nr:septum formation initiator family protein [Alistipes sp.]
MSDKKKKTDSKKKLKKKRTKKALFNGVLLRLVSFAAVIGCAVLIFATESDRREKEREIAAIQAQIDACKIENEELERTLEGDDLSAYIERIALEEQGYAYPDERRFYDTSRD